MYNGRQRRIQTESIQHRSVGPWTQKWVKSSETCQEQRSQRQKNKNTWQKEKCTRSETACARHKKEINNQCNVTFGSTVVNQIVFISLLHMPFGKVCQQGKEISIIKQTEYNFSCSPRLRGESIRYPVAYTPKAKAHPLLKNFTQEYPCNISQIFYFQQIVFS